MTTENINQHSDVIRNALEQQRLQIARDLHDEVGSGLTSLKLELSWIERHTDGKIAQRAREARSQISSLADAGHRLLGNLRTPRTDADFFHAIQSQIARVEHQSNLDIDFSCELNGQQLPEDARKVIYFTILESLTNVQRHAHASSVNVSLVANPSHLSLTVVDDGIGLPGNQEAELTRFGLRGLRERATQIGGEFSAWSPGKLGTTVCLHIPLRPETPAPRSDDSRRPDLEPTATWTV